ncbi:MAG TPA: DUF4233 domain-containing protein [Micromonosporaceae bacterium]|nr:DUF4233 domain-containing protein [Micromonosporaceae bacterium]
MKEQGKPPPSGLRNPAAAVHGLGVAALSIETLVLLLAIAPLAVLGGERSGWAISAVIVLAVAAVVLAGSLRRGWAWPAATALQALLMLAGFLHWSLGALGLIFALVWVYVLHVRRTILG